MKTFFVTLFLFAAGAALALPPFFKTPPPTFPVQLTALLDTNATAPFTGINFYYAAPTDTNPIYLGTAPATNGQAFADAPLVYNQPWNAARFFYGEATNANTGAASDYFVITNLPTRFVLRAR